MADALVTLASFQSNDIFIASMIVGFSWPFGHRLFMANHNQLILPWPLPYCTTGRVNSIDGEDLPRRRLFINQWAINLSFKCNVRSDAIGFPYQTRAAFSWIYKLNSETFMVKKKRRSFKDKLQI